jgi:hypothetical protein
MRFLLIDTAVALAALTGYWVFEVLARGRLTAVTLARRIGSRSGAVPEPGRPAAARQVRRCGPEYRAPRPEWVQVDPRRLVKLQ